MPRRGATSGWRWAAGPRSSWTCRRSRGCAPSPSSPWTPGSATAGSARPRSSPPTREAGLALLEDLGDDLYARLCDAAPGREAELYAAAVDVLADIQRRPPPSGDWTPPPYDRAFLMREVGLVPEWYLPAATGVAPSPALVAEYDALCGAALAPVADVRAAPVLRDYHAENLLWLPERDGRGPGRPPRLPGHAPRPSGLRPRLAARGRPPRRARRAAHGADRPLSRAHRGRPRGLPACRRHPLGPAQPQDPRPLHPALPPRRQAALSRPPAAGLGASRPRPRPSRPRPADAFVARHVPPPEPAVLARIGGTG